MTDLTRDTTHRDPVAERMARICENVNNPFRSPRVDDLDFADLYKFARDVLALHADADPECCNACSVRAVYRNDIRDAAARHLGRDTDA